MLDLPSLENVNSDKALKLCCTAVYETQWAQLLLGDSFHPGGIALTERLGHLLNFSPEDKVLDVASGRGTTAIFLAETFGCEVIGLEYGTQSVAEANELAQASGVADRVHFKQGDAELLPFDDGFFDVVICECAFCTFPNKAQAAAEWNRVLGKNGRIGISDLTKQGTLPPELETLIAWIACIADAQPIETYTTYLQNAAFTVTHIENHNAALAETVQQVRSKLLTAELMVKLGKIDFPDADFTQAKTIAKSAKQAVRQGKLGYAILVGEKSA